MPRFKPVDYSPRFLAVDLSRQLLPGNFEYALHHLLDHEIDLCEIESRYSNDEVGASAYEPRVLLKLILLAYCHAIVSSRGIEAACGSNVQFIALSGDPPAQGLCGNVPPITQPPAALDARIRQPVGLASQIKSSR